jgi:acetyltransferase-like isoleucine patch superfamily enzyme
MSHELIRAPRVNAAEGAVRLIAWCAADGAAVQPGDVLATFETSKATFELDAERAGFLFHAVAAGTEVQVGAPIGAIADERERPDLGLSSPASGSAVVITEPARLLLERHGLDASACPGRAVIRAADVEAFLARRAPARPTDAASDRDAPLASEASRAQRDLLTSLRQRMRARFDRHVPTGDLLHDRWELARDLGFGEGTSVYDDSLILGDVRVGAHFWIGPFTVLDGAHAPLSIGDYTQVGAGSQIYTHHTIRHVLSGGRAPTASAATEIGRCCFLSPMVVIGPGTRLGDHSFVASGSFVEGAFPSHSYVAGAPARRVGAVEIEGDEVRLRRDDQ